MHSKFIKHHHHHLWCRLGHRPLAKSLPAPRSWVSLSRWSQSLFSWFLISASRSQHQTFLPQPPLVLPCGFQIRVCLAVLDVRLRRVWPIHLQCLWKVPQLLSYFLSQALVGDGVRPVHQKDLSEADVDEDLHSFHDYSGSSPCFSSIE